MLTPSKIKNHHFEAAGKNAYRAQSVDDFFDIVADSYEQMFKENGELVKKISLLAERLEEYRNDEDNIRAALLTAQRMADQIMRETNEKAEAQMADATANAKKIEENATLKANEVVAKAQAQADAALAQAATNAKRLIEDATAESKEQAVIARDRMIKTQAALGLVEQEADKFKKDLLSLYSQHIELISKIPEIQQETIAQEPEVEPEEEPETVEQAVYPVLEEAPQEEPVVAEEDEESVDNNFVEEVIETVPFEETAQEVVEAPQAEEEISDDKLRDLGFDIPNKEDFTPVETEDESLFSYIDNSDKDDDSDTADFEDVSEVDDGFTKDDGIKFDLSSLKFGAVEDDEEEFFDDEDDDEDYYDDEDEDDNDDGFGSKLKGFFKR